MTPFDAYEILEVERDADAVTIRRAYQKLARRCHPDFASEHPGAARRFEDVERAYRILGDPDRRRRYDAGLPPESTRPPVRPSAPRRRVVTATYVEFRAARRSGPRLAPDGTLGPRDLAAEVAISFADAVRGTIASLSVQRERRCEACGGERRSAGGGVCDRCAGRGLLIDLDRVRTRLPAGIEDGARVRLRGQGQPGVAGAADGDLFLTVRVEPHSYFERAGLDVHADVPVTFSEAALGAEIDVPTLDGRVRVKLPAGTAGGQRFRLPGRGIRISDDVAGDHFYRIRIVVPSRLDGALRAALERLPKTDPRADLPDEPV